MKQFVTFLISTAAVFLSLMMATPSPDDHALILVERPTGNDLETDCFNPGSGCGSGSDRFHFEHSTDLPAMLPAMSVGLPRLLTLPNETIYTVRVAGEQHLLMTTRHTVLSMNHETGSVKKLLLSDGFHVGDAVYLQQNALYVVSGLKQAAEKLEQSLFIFNEAGKLTQTQPIDEKKDGYVRQVMVANDSILVHHWKPGLYSDGTSSFRTAFIDNAHGHFKISWHAEPVYTEETAPEIASNKRYVFSQVGDADFLIDPTATRRIDLATKQSIDLDVRGQQAVDYHGGDSFLAVRAQSLVSGMFGDPATPLVAMRIPNAEHQAFGGKDTDASATSILMQREGRGEAWVIPGETVLSVAGNKVETLILKSGIAEIQSWELSEPTH